MSDFSRFCVLLAVAVAVTWAATAVPLTTWDLAPAANMSAVRRVTVPCTVMGALVDAGELGFDFFFFLFFLFV
jgi:hypothetical protein